MTHTYRPAVALTAAIAILSMAATLSPHSTADDHVASEGSVLDPAVAVARQIDGRIEARWREAGVSPAPAADDAEFLRRTFLNIAGRIPSVAETREFLDDGAPDKRSRLVERLLESPAYVNNFTNVYRRLMIPEADAELQGQVMSTGFERWLRRQLIDNVGYDSTARELLTSSLEGETSPAGMQQEGPQAFYRFKQAKPENLASSVARLYLGVQLDCAQCHDHPFTTWRQEDFWGFAAFFAGIEGERYGELNEDTDRRSLKIPEKNKVVPATFLDGAQPKWDDDTPPRRALADWLTSAENPYFARAAVNRIWAHFFGIGLVDPVDDFDVSNPPSHPELLDQLARDFAASGYDVKFLIRAITASRAYQLTSRQTDDSQSDQRLFARMQVKGLTARQLFDSLALLVFNPDETPVDPTVVGPMPDSGMLEELFREDETDSTQFQTSILQALALMNGQRIDCATDPSQNAVLGAVIESPFFDTEGRIETLFLATLNRRPSADELSRFTEYVDQGGTKSGSRPAIDNLFEFQVAGRNENAEKDSHIALGDVFWALLNSSEFRVNH